MSNITMPISMITTSFFSGEIIPLGRNCQEWGYMINAYEYFYGSECVAKLLAKKVVPHASWLFIKGQIYFDTRSTYVLH